MSSLYESFLRYLPASRSDWVNDLEIPLDILPSPDIWMDLPDDLSYSSVESIIDPYARSTSADSSLCLSRAMTDSDIDYERYNRYYRYPRNPWDYLRSALNAFPPAYLTSLSHYTPASALTTSYIDDVIVNPYRNEALLARMNRFFDDIQPFGADDPGLIALEEAIQNLKISDTYFYNDYIYN